MNPANAWFAVLFSRPYWSNQFSIWTLLLSLFAALGGLWTSVEAFTFFAAENYAKEIKKHWELFLLLGLLMALWQMRPKLSVTSKIDERDISIEIRIGDAVRSEGTLVVPINSTFDTNIGDIFKTLTSVQGALLHHEYEGNTTHLDADIEAALKKEGHQPEAQLNKSGKLDKYRIGTVITIKPSQRQYYLLATSDLNREGRSRGTVEDVRNSLASLWSYVSERGDKGHIVIPLIGTGKGRIPTPRSEICKEIVRSFIAACAQGTFCDKLTIVIYYRDVSQNRIDLKLLGSFLEHACTNTQFAEQGKPPIGTGLNG
jgi:hypothetical protein